MSINWYEEFPQSGITENTPKEIMLNAVTLFKNLVFSSATNKWSGTVIGATSGGSKFSIKPELLDLDLDGANVKQKGLTKKIGETAQVETNMVELTNAFFKTTTLGEEGQSEDARFNVIESKEDITDDDYIENFGCVGFKTTGEPVIIIFDHALCTSGVEGEGKKKEGAVIPATFECYAPLGVNKLPWHIYTVKPAV